MAWTAPRTWTTGELVTAAIMNTHVRDDFLAAGRAYARGHANVTVTAAVDTDLISITVIGGDLSTDRWLEIDLWGTYAQNANGGPGTMKLKYGATTLSSISAFGDNSASTIHWHNEAKLIAAGATNAQESMQHLSDGPTNEHDWVDATGTAAIDSTANQTLKLTWTWGSAGGATLTMTGFIIKLFGSA